MSEHTSVRLPTRAWNGDGELELAFPASWEVVTCRMKGHARTPLDDAGFREAFARPIGSPTIRELARERREAVIIFDDMSRPTKVAAIVPYVLEELRAGGIGDQNIRFVMALGAHGAASRIDFAKKLGAEVVARYPVYNHNVYESCVDVGRTPRGTRVRVNAEVMKCDLRIGIGSIIPHLHTGFGGGAKIILPGVCSIDTIESNHEPLRQTALRGPEAAEIGLAKYERNAMRLDMVDAARLAGLDVVVNSLVNIRRDPTHLFVGDVELAFQAGARVALEHYGTPFVPGADIVVANAYGKGNEALLSLAHCAPFFRGRGVDFVPVVNAPEGQVTHYMYGPFGRGTGGRFFSPRVGPMPGINRMIIASLCPDKAGEDWMSAPGSTVVRSWEEALRELQGVHRAGARVAVVPDATVQYFVGA